MRRLLRLSALALVCLALLPGCAATSHSAESGTPVSLYYEYQNADQVQDLESIIGVEKRSVSVNYEVGDLVTIIHGSFDGFSGIVDKIDVENDTVRVIISMMGRDTPLELGLDQVESAVD